MSWISSAPADGATSVMDESGRAVATSAAIRVLAALLIVCGCGTQPPDSPPLEPVDSTLVVRPPALLPDTIIVALTEAIDPAHVPVARNRSERIVFNHLYETLLRLDGNRELQPGLANLPEQLSKFELQLLIRSGAKFSDGSRVTARDLAACHAVDLDVDRTAETDTVRLAWDLATCAQTLAYPGRAVYKPLPGAAWPLGTSNYQVASWVPSRGELILAPIEFGPFIRFVVLDQAIDTRDAMDSIDVLVTDDPAVIEYAGDKPDWITAPLSWASTYVLISPMRGGPRPQEVDADGIARDAGPRRFSDALARDAVRSDARVSAERLWGESLKACAWSIAVPEGPRIVRTRVARSILYSDRDLIARDLAQRLVALAGTDTSESHDAAALMAALPELAGARPLSAEGVREAYFNERLAAGNDAAYVVRTLRAPQDWQRASNEMRIIAPWLRQEAAQVAIPLVDVRSHVIVRSGSAGIRDDQQGGFIIETGVR